MSTVIEIINNSYGTYEGDLKYYFKEIWNSENTDVPYHNIRHMLHVTWACHDGAMFYKNKMNKRTIRNLLIAAMFHDYGHVGKAIDDSVNIHNAITALLEKILPEDLQYYGEIVSYIRNTQFPQEFRVESLPALIIKDADLAYTLSDVWIHTVAFGLGKEINLSPKQMLMSQEPFLKSLKFETTWAQNIYGQKLENRINEVKQMIDVLYN